MTFVELIPYLSVVAVFVWVLRMLLSGPVSPRDRRFLRERQREIDRRLFDIQRAEFREQLRERRRGPAEGTGETRSGEPRSQP